MSNISPPSPSPFLNRAWPLLVFLLTAFGVPIAAINVFSHFITEHPLLALMIGLSYEVGVFILAFLGKVCQKLESRWVDRIADQLDSLVQNIFSRYRKHYCQYLRYQHRDFDVKGLTTLGTYTLELNQVFVELSIDPTTFKQMSANPVSVPQKLYAGNHAIWDYLASMPLANQHLVIIGPPGSGKTTLLKHITLSLVAHRKERCYQHQAKIPHKLPILLFLRDYVQSITGTSDFTLADALHEHLKKWEQPEPPARWIKRQLTKGRCLIMLDGLDEVADLEMRLKVVDWVQKQMTAFKESRFLITSRPFGYRSNPLNSVAVLEVRPFSPEQVERFVHQWYLANEIMSKRKDDPGVHMRARAEARGLLQRLRDTPALFALTVNPLLLTMITTVHRYGGELPGNRVALYAEICEVFLGKRQQARGQSLELTPAQMQLVLGPLAYHLMLNGKRDITLAEVQTVIKTPLVRVNTRMLPEAFLRLVENASGLLLERENGIYSFAHQTFQEYLAASYMRKKQLGDNLVAHIEESWWQETIRLYCAMADATPIIAACLISDHPSVLTLTLALDCEKEARDIEPNVKDRLETVLDQGAEDPDPERQHVIAEALLIRRLRQMAYLKEGVYIDTSLVTCVEYQVFLDSQRAHGKYYQPDHWTEYHFSLGQGHMPVLGVQPSDAVAFCAWLTEYEQGLWNYRLPRTDELREIGDQFAGTGYWLDESQGFVWVKGTSLSLDNVPQEDIDLVRFLIRARALARDLDLALDSARAFDRTLDSARDLDLAFDNASILDITRTFTRALDSARAFTRALNRNIDITRALDLALDSAHALTRALDSAHALTRALDSAHALTRDLARALDLAFDCILDGARALDLTPAHDLIRALDLDLVRTLDLDRSLDHERDLALDLDRSLDRERSRDSARALDLVLEIVSSYHFFSPAISQGSSRWKKMLLGLLRIKRQQLFHPRNTTRREDSDIQIAINSYLNVYIALTMLGKRIQREIPAYEGILLVKERKKE